MTLASLVTIPGCARQRTLVELYFVYVPSAATFADTIGAVLADAPIMGLMADLNSVLSHPKHR
jgi:hypothetical protein